MEMTKRGDDQLKIVTDIGTSSERIVLVDLNRLPEYKTEYPSRYPKGTLGWVLDQESGVEEVTAARKAAIVADYNRRPPMKCESREGCNGTAKWRVEESRTWKPHAACDKCKHSLEQATANWSDANKPTFKRLVTATEIARQQYEELLAVDCQAILDDAIAASDGTDNPAAKAFGRLCVEFERCRAALRQAVKSAENADSPVDTARSKV